MMAVKQQGKRSRFFSSMNSVQERGRFHSSSPVFSEAQDIMPAIQLRMPNSLKEVALAFVLGGVGGLILGAIENPVDRTLSMMCSEAPLNPVKKHVEEMGALGLGNLIGATALTSAMTSLVAGVILAAATASVFVATRGCGASHIDMASLWASAGLAGAFGTTLSGATLGVIIEWIATNYTLVGLLWALGIFTMIKPILRFIFKTVWMTGEACCTQVSTDWTKEKEQINVIEFQQRERVTVQVEQKILSLEAGNIPNETEQMMEWSSEQKQRKELERKKMETEEAELEQRTIHDWINTVVLNHVDFLAFSGIPMAVVAMVTAGFGIFGYGSHQSVFIILLALVATISYLFFQSSDFKFWMLVGCMGMLATFAIAMLTLHAGQVVVTTAMKREKEGQSMPKDVIRSVMNEQSALEALNTAFFAAKLCQLGLGATVGGPLVRQIHGENRVIVGAALVAGTLLAMVEALTPVLGNGGRAGALLGVVGVAGVSVGAAEAMMVMSSSWMGTLGTFVGLILGVLGLGNGNVIKIGLQLSVVFIFAMGNPF